MSLFLFVEGSCRFQFKLASIPFGILKEFGRGQTQIVKVYVYYKGVENQDTVIPLHTLKALFLVVTFPRLLQ